MSALDKVVWSGLCGAIQQVCYIAVFLLAVWVIGLVYEEFRK